MLVIARKVGESMVVNPDTDKAATVTVKEILGDVVGLKIACSCGISYAFRKVDTGVIVGGARILIASIVSTQKVRLGVRAPKHIKALRSEKLQNGTTRDTKSTKVVK